MAAASPELMTQVQSQQQLVELSERLAGETLIGADAEAAGYHRYNDEICLLTLATRAETFVVDTLALDALDGLGSLLAARTPEIVLHDASYDVRLLSRDFGATVGGLFDTKIAAEFLGEPAPGLAKLLKKHLGVRLEKEHTLADWAERPLPPELLEYAAADVRHLPALRDRLRERLVECGRLAWAEEEFRLQEQIRWTPSDEEGEAYLGVKNAHKLDPRGLAALRELYAWRDGEAREQDRALFRILPDRLLLSVAQRRPRSPDDLPGGRRTLRYAEPLLAAVERALALPEQELPERPRRPRRPRPDPDFKRLVDELRSVRTRTAEALELDPGFLMPRRQLETVARHFPESRTALGSVPGVREWQIEALGDKLLAALRSHRARTDSDASPNRRN